MRLIGQNSIIFIMWGKIPEYFFFKKSNLEIKVEMGLNKKVRGTLSTTLKSPHF